MGMPEAEPTAVDDFLILVPPRLLEQRRKEWAGYQVEPIQFNPNELDVSSWENLMCGQTTSAVAQEVLNEIMEDNIGDMSVGKILDAIATHDDLTDMEKRDLRVML